MLLRHAGSRGAALMRRALLAWSLVCVACSVGFVLAPVDRPHAVYSWPASAGDARAVAIPLMLHAPAAVHASVSCAAARAAGPGTVLLSTTPLDHRSGVERLPGLQVSVGEDRDLQVTSAETSLTPQPVPATQTCTWELDSDAWTTTLRRDGAVVDQRDGDLRPTVAGVFSDAGRTDGLSVDVTANTVFQTSPSPLKIALAVVALLGLAGVLVQVARGDRTADRSTRAGRDQPQPDQAVGRGAGSGAVTQGLPHTGGPAGRRPARRSWLRWPVDGAVVVVLAVWTAIGPITVDDGYIAGIIRGRDANGYVGNVFRWFNAPEAPFGWHYELLDAWSAVSASTVWMRVPSSVLGVVTWFVLARGLVPRLGPLATRAFTYPLAALVFTAWWLPTNLGMRPEPWVAAGLVTVVVLVERGLERERLLPVLLAVVVAAAALAVNPIGAVACLPLLAAAVPLLRLGRSRTSAGLPTHLAAAAAAGSTGLLLMFADQSPAAVRLANRIRGELPGALPWSQEPERWYLLLTAQDIQGALERRVPVLLTLLAVLTIVWRRSRLTPPSRDVVDGLVTVSALALVVMTFTPTKWTLHFGSFAAIGTALILVGTHLFWRTGDESQPAAAAAEADRDQSAQRWSTGALTATTAGLSLVLLVAAYSYAGWNQWAWLSNLDIPWNDIPPQLVGVPFSTVFLLGAVSAALAGTAMVVAARTRRAQDVRVPAARWIPSPALVAMALVGLTVALQLGSFVKSSVERRDTYTLANDATSAASGAPCGLAPFLSAEPDPVRGVLTPAATQDSGPSDESTQDGFADVVGGGTAAGPELRMADRALPGWSATDHRSADGTGPAELRTEWFALPGPATAASGPLVVTMTGDRGIGTNVIAEFGVVEGGPVVPIGARGVPDPGGAPAARDGRVDPTAVPAGANVVRLIASDAGADTDVPLSVSHPRVPVTVPFEDVVDSTSPALVDWPVAFVFPCQELAVQVDGVTDVPEWRIAPALPSDAGDIVVAGFVGGPYAPAYSLVDQVQVPVYQRARPLERPITLFRWKPRVDDVPPRVTVRERRVSAWEG